MKLNVTYYSSVLLIFYVVHKRQEWSLRFLSNYFYAALSKPSLHTQTAKEASGTAPSTAAGNSSMNELNRWHKKEETTGQVPNQPLHNLELLPRWEIIEATEQTQQTTLTWVLIITGVWATSHHSRDCPFVILSFLLIPSSSFLCAPWTPRYSRVTTCMLLLQLLLLPFAKHTILWTTDSLLAQHTHIPGADAFPTKLLNHLWTPYQTSGFSKKKQSHTERCDQTQQHR